MITKEVQGQRQHSAKCLSIWVVMVCSGWSVAKSQISEGCGKCPNQDLALGKVGDMDWQKELDSPTGAKPSCHTSDSEALGHGRLGTH